MLGMRLAKFIAKMSACSVLLVLPSCGIPPLRHPAPGPELPPTFQPAIGPQFLPQEVSNSAAGVGQFAHAQVPGLVNPAGPRFVLQPVSIEATNPTGQPLLPF